MTMQEFYHAAMNLCIVYDCNLEDIIVSAKNDLKIRESVKTIVDNIGRELNK